MYIPLNQEFGSALSKLRNFEGMGFEPHKSHPHLGKSLKNREADTYGTHRCVSKKRDTKHISIQYITIGMNWPCAGKQVHQSSVKADVFSTGGQTGE
jgi:hypothetical protein